MFRWWWGCWSSKHTTPKFLFGILIINWLFCKTVDKGVALKSCPFVKEIYIYKGNKIKVTV
jgi:fluoride ion exporter CrcB/FEX